MQLRAQHVLVFITLLLIAIGCGPANETMKKKTSKTTQTSTNSNYNTNTNNAPASSTLNFISLQQSVFSPKCGQCHGLNQSNGGVSFKTYQSLMGAGVVVAGKPANSKLCEVVYNGIMPPTGKLSSADINAICGWIQAGAKQ